MALNPELEELIVNGKRISREERDAKVLEKFNKSESRDIKKQIDSGKREITNIVDMGTGNDHFLIDEKPKQLPDGNLDIKGKVVATDPKKLPFQALNKNKFTVVWECQMGMRRSIRHAPWHWIILPDHYFTPWIEFIGNKKENGTPINMKVNMGKDINFKLQGAN